MGNTYLRRPHACAVYSVRSCPRALQDQMSKSRDRPPGEQQKPDTPKKHLNNANRHKMTIPMPWTKQHDININGNINGHEGDAFF